MLSSRVQARPTQHVKDVACGGGRLDVVVRKRRYACREQLPARARVTTRLAEQVISACRAEPRAVSRVAHQASLSWPTVMRMLTTTLDLHTGVDRRHVKRLGTDEHRFRTVRYLRDPDTHAVKRVEPWSIVFTDLEDGDPGRR